MGAVYAELQRYQNMEFEVKNLWDGNPCPEAKPVKFQLSGASDSDLVNVKIEAPFYDDPPPTESGNSHAKKGAYYRLWDYEVVEIFFLSSKDNMYLEVEFGPHGHHLGLLLNGRQKCIKHSFPIDYKAEIDRENGKWNGHAKLPREYFPTNVDKFNAYAIHGDEPHRVYRSLFPVPGQAADFHRLEYFQDFGDGGKQLLGQSNEMSEIWKNALEEKQKHPSLPQDD